MPRQVICRGILIKRDCRILLLYDNKIRLLGLAIVSGAYDKICVIRYVDCLRQFLNTYDNKMHEKEWNFRL